METLRGELTYHFMLPWVESEFSFCPSLSVFSFDKSTKVQLPLLAVKATPRELFRGSKENIPCLR